MKKIILPFLILFTVNSFSQSKELDSKDDYLEDLQILERKAASQKMNFQRNPNTDNYDLKYHRLEWNVDPAISFISGSVTTYFEAKSDMNTITFDLASNMNVTEVLQRGNSLTFSQNGNDEVVITLPVTQNTGVLDSVTVSYNGSPQNTGGFGSFETSSHGGTPVLWTLSEPYGAKAWWPCKQDLVDKIDKIDVYVTHPSQYKTASNGLLKSETISGSDMTTHWKHEYPIPAYLIAIAVTNYTVYTNHVDNGDFDVVNYVYPENLTTAQNGTAITPDIMDLFGDLFEIYPYSNEKYGHAEFGWGGGMEHTTMTFMGGWYRLLVAHELAHQWFGNKVTCGSWEDIWLNEGFATYLNALVIENFDGQNAFRNWKQSTTNNITSSNDGSVFVNDTTSVGRIFNGRLSYDKGSMLVHMLRYKLGDANFFQGVKNYLSDPALAYGYAKTIHLQEHLEATGGEDLTEYFDDWFRGEGHPSFQVNWNYNATNQNVNFTVNQTQSHGSVSFFETPLPIKVNGSGGQSEIIRLELTENGQYFSEPIGFVVTSAQIDTNKELISRNNTIQMVLSTEDNTLEHFIKVYPNPTKETLNIENNSSFEITKLSIFNMLGQEVYTEESPLQIISLKSLKTGVFTLKIETNQGVLLKTIIKN